MKLARYDLGFGMSLPMQSYTHNVPNVVVPKRQISANLAVLTKVLVSGV